jgi:hypothetical protein
VRSRKRARMIVVVLLVLIGLGVGGFLARGKIMETLGMQAQPAAPAHGSLQRPGDTAGHGA